MEQNEAVVAVLSMFMGCLTLIVLVGTWLKHRKNVAAQALTSFENRLARLEVALDDVTVELGRMTESHQLLAKSLADRQALPR
jgi:hypothetical protein